MNSIKIFISTGEPSGDLHAASLVEELSKTLIVDTFGTGGVKLAALGQRQLCGVNELAVIGFDAVLKKIPFLMRLAGKIIKTVGEEQPDVALLVDYAGFNLKLAAKLKKNFPNLPVIGYIAPQVWVWHKSRVKYLRKYFDKVLCILPFEEEFLRNEGVDAVYIGNPVVDGIKFTCGSREEFCRKYNVDGKKVIVGMIPGSREREVRSLMPVMMAARDKELSASFVAACADSVPVQLIKEYTDGKDVTVVKGATHDIMKYSDILWICSGTATLEAAVIGTPMVILYQSGWINFTLIRMLTSLRMVGLPNIIAEKSFNSGTVNQTTVPELLWKKCNPHELIKAHNEVMSRYIHYKNVLKPVGELFLSKTPSKNAAAEILALAKGK